MDTQVDEFQRVASSIRRNENDLINTHQIVRHSFGFNILMVDIFDALCLHLSWLRIFIFGE